MSGKPGNRRWLNSIDLDVQMISRLKHFIYSQQKRERYAYLKELLNNERMSRELLLQKQQRELTDIITFAANNTDFYQHKYQQAMLHDLDDLALKNLPILRKEEVVQYRDAMVARGLDRGNLRLGHTGGSTGRPLAFYYDNHKTELMRAGMMRSYMWSGWLPGEKILNFWGARQDIKGGGGFRKKVGDYIAAERTIGAYEYTQAQLHEWAKFIQSYKPVLLQGYASILAGLAGYIIEQRMRMPKSLKGVFSTAEVLYEWQREAIESAFSCKVFNQYGSREIPNIALQCRHGNFHVFTDMVYLESLNRQHEDRFLVTSLTNRVMPFIRYEIGDSGRLRAGDCPCGSPFPLMEMEFCRSNDIIVTPGGKRIYPSYFIHLLDGVKGINQYQFVQNELNRITLNIDAASGLAPGLQTSLQQRITNEIDKHMTLEINQVNEIKRTRSGKHRFVINARSN